VNEESYNKFPSARMLATSHVNLTVLLTFGLVFPPLAVIIALLVLVQTWLHLEMIAASLSAWFRQHCKQAWITCLFLYSVDHNIFFIILPQSNHWIPIMSH
jgi:hypothetical protein